MFAADCALRLAMLWRKGEGAQIPVGSHFVERLLTVSATCRQHKQYLLSFLVEVVQARCSGQAAPTLVGAEQLQ
jgi:transposase